MNTPKECTVYRHKKWQTAKDLATCRLMNLILFSVFASATNRKFSLFIIPFYFVFSFIPITAINTRISVPTDIAKNAIFRPCIEAFSPSAADYAVTIDIIPTKTAAPIDPETVRSEVRSEDASDVFNVST